MLGSYALTSGVASRPAMQHAPRHHASNVNHHVPAMASAAQEGMVLAQTIQGRMHCAPHAGGSAQSHDASQPGLRSRTMTHSTACSTSASSNTTRHDLPPSSMVAGRRFCAAARFTRRPVATLPVKATWAAHLVLSARPAGPGLAQSVSANRCRDD